MLHLLAILILLTSLSSPLFSQVKLTGEAVKVDDRNPTAAIAAFSGNAEMRARLEEMLTACDWFTVIDSARSGNATVQLRVDGSAGGGRHFFNGSAAVAGKGTFTLEAVGGTVAEAAAGFVDTLLKQLFNVPALCRRRIVYVQTGKNGLKELFSCDITGGDIQRLTHNNAISTEPSWGHANAFVYTLNSKNSLSVVLFDAANNRQRVISSARGLNSNPALSPNGRYVALPMSLDNQIDLFIIDLKNSRRTKLTVDRNVESSPAFSPDGRQLCYVSDKSGRPQLYLMNIDGSASRRLTHGSEAVSPEWSPVSNKICFAQRSGAGQYVIKVLDMNRQDSEAETVTLAAGNWEAPSWAPDGRHVVCTRKSGSRQQLYLVDTWLNSFRHIPLRAGGVSLPAWQSAR